jgi:hypothetical protein
MNLIDVNKQFSSDEQYPAHLEDTCAPSGSLHFPMALIF